MTKKRMSAILAAAALIVLMASSVVLAHATGFPAYQDKNLFETETVEFTGLTTVLKSDGSAVSDIELKFFNTTTQEQELTVTSDSEGMLPAIHLKKNHNYMVLTPDGSLFLAPVYIWVSDHESERSGDFRLLNIKDCNGTYKTDCKFSEISSFKLTPRREYQKGDPDNRYRTRIPVVEKLESGNSSALLKGVNFILVSEDETVKAKTIAGYISVDLKEDVQYAVICDSDQYDVELFPLTVKDHSERGEERNTYDHSSCKGVGQFYTVADSDPDPDYFLKLVRKGESHRNDTAITSKTGLTTIEGMNFKDLFVQEKYLDTKVNRIDGEYDVVRIIAVNPHRWEISKICAGDFKITEKLKAKKEVSHIYELHKDGSLEELAFTQDGSSLKIETGNLSLYPYVIEYKEHQHTPLTIKGRASTCYKAGLSKGVCCSECGEVITPQKTLAKKAVSKPTLKAGKGKITVRKSRISGSTAFQIRYSTSKDSKGKVKKYKTLKVGTKKGLKKTIKKLKRHRKYYVQVRAVKKTGGKVLYSSWSATASVKTK